MATSGNRKEVLEKLRNNRSSLDRFAAPDMSSELLNFRPALEDAWTIQENLVHVLDSEMGLFLRIRQAVANPGSDAASGTPLESWKELFDHSLQSIEDTVGAFKKIHSLAYELLKGIEDKDWSTFFLNHPTRGKWTLDDIAGIVAGHVDFHLELIERNEKLFKEKNK
jgi:hypothetical protein